MRNTLLTFTANKTCWLLSLGVVAAINANTAFSATPTGASVALIHQFSGTDGKNPNELTVTADGSIYGTTKNGGQFDDGALFKINSTGVFNVLRNFNTGSEEGGLPTGWVGVGNDGSIYGTTTSNNSDGFDPRRGTIYRLAANGAVSVIVGGGSLGANSPITKFAFKPDGTVYGAYNLSFSGASGNYFKYVPGTNTVTYNPIQLSIGLARQLNPGLIVGRDGNLYGTTMRTDVLSGGGAVYKIDDTGNFAVVHDFTPTLASGSYPNTLVNEDSAGNLYGTTTRGGSGSYGVVYKLALNANGSRTYSVLNNFSANDGTSNANGTIVIDAKEVLPDGNGNLYGTTAYGGANSFGVFYQIDAQGNYTVLHDFTSAEGHPGNLVKASNNTFYVPTSDTANPNNFGAIYKITPDSSNTNLPDVVLTSVNYDNGLFTSTVRNIGTLPTPADKVIGVGYSVDGSYRTWGAVRGPLLPGQSVTIGNNGPAFAMPTGTHQITARVDDINRFAESNELNNSLSIQFTNAILPDLTATSVSYNPTTGTFASTIANLGNASIAGYIGVGYYVDGVYKTWGTVRNIAANSGPVAVGTNGTPFVIPPGSHTITAKVNDIKRIVETNYSNNDVSKAITVQ